MKKIAMSTLALCALVAVGCGGSDPVSGRGAELVTCTPGSTVSVGCGALMLGTCTGDPILTICDGATTTDPNVCDDTMDIDRNDDRMGLCPGLEVTCPASGSIAVRPSAFGTREFSCEWTTSEMAGTPDAGP